MLGFQSSIYFVLIVKWLKFVSLQQAFFLNFFKYLSFFKVFHEISFGPSVKYEVQCEDGSQQNKTFPLYIEWFSPKQRESFILVRNTCALYGVNSPMRPTWGHAKPITWEGWGRDGNKSIRPWEMLKINPIISSQPLNDFRRHHILVFNTMDK